MGVRSGSYLDTFIDGYVTCMLWSTNDESTPDGGVPLDDNHGPSDIAPEAMDKIRKDCATFVYANRRALREYADKANRPADYAGHDFWLNRNGHGTGFWDRGAGDLGDKLSEASRETGEVWPYVGDDGRIYLG